MSEVISLSIETACLCGGVALGRGECVVAQDAFDSSQRHATHLVVKLKALLEGQGLAPADLDELYVSAGPGSFTGTRVGVTVARTLAQATGRLRCVAVPTAWAVAQGALAIDWPRLAVLSDATEAGVHLAVFARRGESFESRTETDLAISELAAALSRPILVLGPAAHHRVVFQSLAGHEGLATLPPDSPYHQSTPTAVWHVGRQLAREGRFIDYRQLLPIYSRPPEAVRVWEKRQQDKD